MPIKSGRLYFLFPLLFVFSKMVQQLCLLVYLSCMLLKTIVHCLCSFLETAHTQRIHKQSETIFKKTPRDLKIMQLTGILPTVYFNLFFRGKYPTFTRQRHWFCCKFKFWPQNIIINALLFIKLPSITLKFIALPPTDV